VYTVDVINAIGIEVNEDAVDGFKGDGGRRGGEGGWSQAEGESEHTRPKVSPRGTCGRLVPALRLYVEGGGSWHVALIQARQMRFHGHQTKHWPTAEMQHSHQRTYNEATD
jgi:hypothetical protein